MKVSVALCTYNGEAYIEEQLTSILHQTHAVDEIVICDDGSTDNTLKIISSLELPNATIHTTESQLGASANFQKAVNLCHGDIIFLSDQDDVWHPDKVEHTIAYFTNHPDKQVLFSNGRLVDDTGNSIEDKTLFFCVGMNKKARKMFDNDMGLDLFIAGNRATGASMALRNTFPYLHSFIDYCHEYIIHDYAISLLALTEGELGYIEDPLIDYRIHPTQQIGMGSYIDSPLGIHTRHIVPTATIIKHHAYPQELVHRTRMVAWREQNLHRWFAPLSILLNLSDYIKTYHHHALGTALGDFNQWFSSRCRLSRR